MRELTTAIVGIDFPNPDRSRSNRRMEIMLTAPGEPVLLRPEPRNRHDANAIAVWSERGVQMGYVPAERAPLIGKRMKEDAVTAIFQALDGTGAYIRIHFGDGAPTLPPPAPATTPNHEPDRFYPDEDGPEWGA